jgi:hypothetical protein
MSPDTPLGVVVQEPFEKAKFETGCSLHGFKG